jgi:hypothetical protein
MLVVFGLCLALPGLLALITGVTGWRRVGRLRQHGTSAWAMVVPAADGRPDWPELDRPRVMIQYTLDDGMVMERPLPLPASETKLTPGERVLIWYDPADPGDAIMYRRAPRRGTVAFMAAGTFFLALGVAIATAR